MSLQDDVKQEIQNVRTERSLAFADLGELTPQQRRAVNALVRASVRLGVLYASQALTNYDVIDPL